MGFAGFFHSDELINLWPCDITIDADMMSMEIVQNNCDRGTVLLWQGQGHLHVQWLCLNNTCWEPAPQQMTINFYSGPFRPFRAPKMVKF